MRVRKPDRDEQGRSPVVALLIPSMEQWYADFGNALLALCANLHHTIDSRYSVINERGSLITLQRESLAELGMAKGAEWLLWLDSDMVFPHDLFNRLVAHKRPLVGCNYVKRIVPATPNTKRVDGKLMLTREDSTGLEEASSAGFGAVLMHRSVFEDLEKPWFDTVWYRKDTDSELEMMGEDVFFFKKVRALKKIPLMIDHDTSKLIGHVGSFEYTNNLAGATFEELDNPELEKRVLG